MVMMMMWGDGVGKPVEEIHFPGWRTNSARWRSYFFCLQLARNEAVASIPLFSFSCGQPSTEWPLLLASLSYLLHFSRSLLLQLLRFSVITISLSLAIHLFLAVGTTVWGEVWLESGMRDVRVIYAPVKSVSSWVWYFWLRFVSVLSKQSLVRSVANLIYNLNQL